jgi:hypothetical protein
VQSKHNEVLGPSVLNTCRVTIKSTCSAHLSFAARLLVPLGGLLQGLQFLLLCLLASCVLLQLSSLQQQHRRAGITRSPAAMCRVRGQNVGREVELHTGH